MLTKYEKLLEKYKNKYFDLKIENKKLKQDIKKIKKIVN